MRTYIDLTEGPITINGTGNLGSTDMTVIAQPLAMLKDLAAFSVLDLELKFFDLEIQHLDVGEGVYLRFETAMQNTDDTSTSWAGIGYGGEGDDINLAEIPAPFTGAISFEGFLRYLRYRIEIPGHTSGNAVTVKGHLQIRGFGRS